MLVREKKLGSFGDDIDWGSLFSTVVTAGANIATTAIQSGNTTTTAVPAYTTTAASTTSSIAGIPITTLLLFGALGLGAVLILSMVGKRG